MLKQGFAVATVRRLYFLKFFRPVDFVHRTTVPYENEPVLSDGTPAKFKKLRFWPI